MLYWSLLTKIFSDITGRCWCGYHDNKASCWLEINDSPEGYVENSIENKTKIANQVLVGTTTSAITKTVNVSESNIPSNINIENCTNKLISTPDLGKIHVIVTHITINQKTIVDMNNYLVGIYPDLTETI
ncbi:hypothetical protein NQ317_010947 [Molorchus minor]|uniref:Uncharacterized protein n=1 Tax=Molorchus minor TaxID=1323400 RepID=A0ABQ9JNA6_9CUCU|nr:hypothetical protein NQ317_010947 [Molorchus minor]